MARTAKGHRAWHELRNGADNGIHKGVLAFLFLRMAEKSGLEPAGQVRRLAEQGSVSQAASLLIRAARRYRSSLLAQATEDIHDRESLRNVVSRTNGLTAVADLGQMYEQMLGPSAARKAAGIYYTPDAIVAVVVRATLGRLLKEKTPEQVRTLTILDPACGCGAFLLVA